MHQALSIRDIQWEVISKLAEGGKADSRAALKAASRVGPFHEEAMTGLFATLHVRDLDGATVLMYKACNVGPYVKTVDIGSEEHMLDVDPRKLEEFMALLPNAQRTVLHPVAIAAPFVLPILSPEYAFHSYVLMASNRPQLPIRDVIPTVDASVAAGVFTTNMRLALPTDGTWSSEVAPEGVENLYMQGIGGGYDMEPHLRYIEAIIPDDAAVAIAFYPSTTMAAANFGRFLQTNGKKLTSLQILWTSAEGQLLDGSLNYTLALGVAACTELESLTVDLFVGSDATSTLEEQMSYLLALVQAANHKTLRALSLVVSVHQDSEVYKYVQELAQLDWNDITNALAPATSTDPTFLGIRFSVFSVLGCDNFVAMDVGTMLYERLVAEQRIPVPVMPYGIPLLAKFC